MSDPSKPARSEQANERPSEQREGGAPDASSEPTRLLLPIVLDHIPKTIPRTRLRTSTVALVLLFLGLLWWYLNLYAQFVPEEQRRSGVRPVVTTSAPAQREPAYEPPITSSTVHTPSSAAHSSGAAGESGAASSTVPGRAPGASDDPSGSASSSPGGLVLPGGVTLPGLPGVPTPPSTSGGAPTTTVPPA